jgi:glycosyltransferase involved in cell wall biosynthesis
MGVWTGRRLQIRTKLLLMRLSLVICTRNRAAQLEKSLQAVQSLQCATPWELIVVDNGSSDDTRDIIERYRSSLPLRLVSETRRGLGRARNRGWRASTGDIVAFTDDDCYPACDYLTSIAQSFEDAPTRGFVGGRVTLFDPRDLPITIKEREEPEFFAPYEFIYAGAIHGANFAFRRSALESIGGFDERLGAGTRFSCEDIDIMARLLATGWSGIYDPRVTVAHHHGRRTILEAKILNREYDRGRGAYYVKCVFNRPIAYVSAKNWYWAMLRQPIGMTGREIAAGTQFLMLRCAGFVRSLVAPNRHAVPIGYLSESDNLVGVSPGSSPNHF